MRVKIKTVMDGPGPSEAVVAIKTTSDRHEEVIVQKTEIRGDTIEVGRIGENADSVLVELPHESAAGNWRLWISTQELA